MGIQILNKDVSIISNVMGKPKANIGSIFGTTGWAGGGDVTPKSIELSSKVFRTSRTSPFNILFMGVIYFIYVLVN